MKKPVYLGVYVHQIDKDRIDAVAAKMERSRSDALRHVIRDAYRAMVGNQAQSNNLVVGQRGRGVEQ